jgi:hypothetical protein
MAIDHRYDDNYFVGACCETMRSMIDNTCL